jgi:hypothetical protein
MNDHDEVAEAARQLAAAIGRRDLNAIREWLAPGFVHRALDGDRADADAFLEAIAGIPGDIMSVTLDLLVVDPTPAGALVTGIQHARVMVDGQVIEDRRAFVDWFVRADGAWRIQAAVDLPHQIPRA